MLIHLPTLKTLGFCCGTRANSTTLPPGQHPSCPNLQCKAVRVPWRLCNQAAKASGFTQSRRASAPEDPVSPQPTTPAGYPAAYFGNATSGRANGNAADHHVPSTTSVARRVNAERDRDDVKSASCYYPHHDAARVVVALVRISMQPFEFDANLVVRKQMLAACRVWVDQLDRRR